MQKTPTKQASPYELPATPLTLSHARATAAHARELLEGARMALRQASDVKTPPTSRFSKTQAPQTAPNDHVQGVKLKHDILLVPRKLETHARGGPSDRGGVQPVNGHVASTPACGSAKTTRGSQSSTDYCIRPFFALPTAESSRSLSTRARALVLSRKKQHLEFLVNEQERLIREVNNMRDQLERLPEELRDLQRDIDAMEYEGELVESSDDDWLHSPGKLKKAARKRDI